MKDLSTWRVLPAPIVIVFGVTLSVWTSIGPPKRALAALRSNANAAVLPADPPRLSALVMLARAWSPVTASVPSFSVVAPP